MMEKIKVIYSKGCPHISRIMTGFAILNNSGQYDVEFLENKDRHDIPSYGVVEVSFHDKIFAFDLSDRWQLAHKEGQEYLKYVDYYFARGYTKKIDIVNPRIDPVDFNKVKPFGFDYYSTYDNNPIDMTDSAYTMKQRLIKTGRKLLRYDECMSPKYVEGKADDNGQYNSVIFYTRLWDPDEVKPSSKLPKEVNEYREYMYQEREQINQMRISLVRELRKQYPDHVFLGGVADSEFSQKVCPELILPKSKTRRKHYLDTMKKADICIGSMGLHKSTGWKTGEYIAAARAIVGEELQYDVPGEFMDGKNYIGFKTVEQCVEAVISLMSSPDSIYNIKKENEDYYQKYLKPDVQILNALTILQ